MIQTILGGTGGLIKYVHKSYKIPFLTYLLSPPGPGRDAIEYNSEACLDCTLRRNNFKMKRTLAVDKGISWLKPWKSKSNGLDYFGFQRGLAGNERVVKKIETAMKGEVLGIRRLPLINPKPFTPIKPYTLNPQPHTLLGGYLINHIASLATPVIPVI